MIKKATEEQLAEIREIAEKKLASILELVSESEYQQLLKSSMEEIAHDLGLSLGAEIFGDDSKT